MDPLLKAIIESGRQGPDSAFVGARAGPTPAAKESFAAPSKTMALQAVMRTMLGLNDPNSIASKIRGAVEGMSGVEGLGGPAKSILIAPGAKTFPFTKMIKAEALERANATPHDIWRELKLARGAEGKWRAEIPDENIRFKDHFLSNQFMNPGSAHSLGSVLEHPRLYEAYPDLQHYSVKWTPKVGGGASFDPIDKDIEIYSPGLPIPRNLAALSSLLHEVQHGIQFRDALNQGASWQDAAMRINDPITQRLLPRVLNEPRNLGWSKPGVPLEAQLKLVAHNRFAGEQEAMSVQRRFMDPATKIAPPEDTEFIPRWAQIKVYD